MRQVLERIRALAELLEVRDGALVKIARDISRDATLKDLEYMRPEDAETLEEFLVAALAAENRLVGVNG